MKINAARSHVTRKLGQRRKKEWFLSEALQMKVGVPRTLFGRVYEPRIILEVL